MFRGFGLQEKIAGNTREKQGAQQGDDCGSYTINRLGLQGNTGMRRRAVGAVLVAETAGVSACRCRR
ncbi:hypothetical protein [Cupriavidus taiwanensis]|uniref:hypothetical protein n=1 Tax=Cupriavidus taiwanensis TaxID=164546 RepID=UPI000E184A1B